MRKWLLVKIKDKYAIRTKRKELYILNYTLAYRYRFTARGEISMGAGVLESYLFDSIREAKASANCPYRMRRYKRRAKLILAGGDVIESLKINIDEE